MEKSDTSKKRKAEALEPQEQEQEEVSDEWKNVSMKMDCLECIVCHGPLREKIYQCPLGHFICYTPCYQKLVKALLCPICGIERRFSRCYGMEAVLESVLIPCSNSDYGCKEEVVYYQKEKHEKKCTYSPCFCPKSGCSFTGGVASLLKHFAKQHGWPSTAFKFHMTFDLQAKPGLRVLTSDDGRHCFMVSVKLLETIGRAISVIRVQPDNTKAAGSFLCCMFWWSYVDDHYQSTRFKIRCSSLSDGLPTGYDFLLPESKLSKFDKLRTIILPRPEI